MRFPLYLTIDLVLCALSITAAVPLYKRLDKISRKAAVCTFLLLCVLSSGFQYICLVRVQAWFVNPEASWLIPMTIAGSAVEEYLFWWSFALIMLELYLYPVIWRQKRTAAISTKEVPCKNAASFKSLSSRQCSFHKENI